MLMMIYLASFGASLGAYDVRRMRRKSEIFDDPILTDHQNSPARVVEVHFQGLLIICPAVLSEPRQQSQQRAVS
jgi:hypothetical protein